ncbi:MAG: RNA polymerase factor sigma-54 [Bacteroidales bacterium]|nr:RNA polymerase factor sigma-54 [Bacteroidales bacterium]
MLEQKLQQKLLQRLSPQQIQLIKMLEIPMMELEQRIKKELEENPALEEGQEETDEPIQMLDDDNQIDENNDNEENENSDDQINEDDNTSQQSQEDDFSYEDFLSEEDQDEIPYYLLQANNQSKDNDEREFVFSSQESFIENLNIQIGYLNLTPKQRAIAEYIVGNIDEKGYLQRDIEQLSDDLAFNLNIQASTHEIEEVLKQIQTLDPPGIGARNISECFLIQLKRKKQTDAVKNAIKIIEKTFEELTKKHYDKIQRKLNMSTDELKEAIAEIQNLNINPGNTYADRFDTAINQVIPDFIVEIDDGEIKVSINSRYSPELRISKSFQEMLYTLEAQAKAKKKAKESHRDAIQFARQKVDSARWFIDAIKQRQDTLLTTMQAIVHLQKDFFLEGDKSLLKPMILKDVADVTGFDISTISRVASNKYVATPFGVFPLKSFFSESMTTDSDEEISTYKIKERIQQLISNEDKSNPLTDEELADLLKKEGLNVARRTIAKYREQLNIPVARLRKELK